MLRSLKIVGLALVVLLLAGCGASEDAGQKGADGSGAKAVVGKVLVKQGPVAGATVTVKTDTGELVGTATTNAEGEYRVPASQSGPFMAEAKEASGTTLYSVSQSSNMNITHLGDYLIREWYKAKGLDIASVFAGLTAGSPVPLEQELTVAANQILTVAANALGKNSVDLFGNELTPTLSKILQATTIEGNGQLRIHLAEVNFNGVYSVKTRVTETGEVAYEGKEETSSDKVPLTKGNIAATVGKVAPPAGASAGQSNEHWMKDNWKDIKDKKLSEIVIPGTHDSGTNDIGVGASVARTQTNSVADQLKDGIRYFDLRAAEITHRGCADPSVWQIFHGQFITFWSYKLNTVLDEVNAFLTKPGNEDEIVILDLQDTMDKYGDERAKNVLVGMFQDRFGKLLAGQEDWQKKTLQELQASNKRVVVLLENGLYTRLEKEKGSILGCYDGKIDTTQYTNRTKQMISLYDEDHAASAMSIKKYTIDAQLNREDAKRNGIENRFADYAFAQNNNYLRVLQIVARPPDGWYITPVNPPTLLAYATDLINGPLNARNGNCVTGELGKRLRMGVEGSRSQWNKANIIIADNYKATTWVLPDYQNGRWQKSFSGSYVDMIIALNKIQTATDPRLANVTDMQDDGQCLQ